MNSYYGTELDAYGVKSGAYPPERSRSTQVKSHPEWTEDWHHAATNMAFRLITSETVSSCPRPASADVFGDGWSVGSTRLSVLNFEGERGSYGEARDEFNFAGYGIVKSLSADSREVRLKGYATGQLIEGTPFLETFQGHVLVTSIESYVWPDVPHVYRVRGLVAAKAPARRSRHHPPSRAYTAFKQLGAWLAMSDDELAKIVEVSRTTVSTSWKHGNEPRKRAQARRLFQLHSVVCALHQVLGDDLLRWLERGNPCPLKLLGLRRYERFERLADEVIFPPSGKAGRRLDTAWAPAHVVHASRISDARRSKPATRARSRRQSR